MSIETPLIVGMQDWMMELKPVDLPSPYDEIATKVGIQAALILAREYGGMMHYLPKLDKPLLKLRNEKIRGAFDGTNHKDLARKYYLTVSQIRTIVDQPDDRQTSFLDHLPPQEK